jgi:transcriptional regulator with XRE-family HTH domain
MQNQIKLIAERIRELRSISGKTEKEIAQACEVKESEYIAYETGEHDIPVGVLYSLAHHFKVELTALITGENRPCLV